MHSEPVNIRSAERIETSVLLDLFNASRANVACYSGKEADLAEFAGLVEGEEIHVAVVGGVIAGFVSVWVADRFIHHLYVSPQYQSRGVGSALLQASVAMYGHPLSLKCDTHNCRALRFYRSKGWLPQETGVGEYGPWERLYAPPA
ncbi:MAG: GNAT family N-acetyltransferase [Thiogranum sp.]|nr:GNAT family N-acetyltransferase [Thiogranum sp.]